MATATYLALPVDDAENVPQSGYRVRKTEPVNLSDESTELVIERALSGDAQAFEELARRYLRPAYTVALAIVRRPADAEDVAQDALLLAMDRLESCREPARFVAWLMTIVRNQARNWLDRRKLRDVLPVEPDDSTAGHDDGNPPSIEREKLLLALERLTQVEREVVLLHDLEGFTHEEIGQTLGVSCVMSRQILFVSRRKLRRSLDLPVGEGGQDE